MSKTSTKSPLNIIAEISENMKSKLTPVQQFYFNTDIFLTGATGFFGKYIIEKLLRSCPDINTIYLLLRPKRGKSIEERLSQIFSDEAFQTIKEQNPNLLSKIAIINGDLSLPGFGINEEDRLTLIENVNIIIHCGATVRFQEPLSRAVKINLMGTKTIINLARKMKHLKSVVCTSTAYSNCNRDEIDEIVYEPTINPESLIQLVNTTKEELLEQITPLLLKNWPNTYTFTKALSEAYIEEYGSDLPVCIVRPSMVTAAYREPVYGWLDNHNGMNGIGYGIGTGLLHVIPAKPNMTMDIIPMDIVGNAIVVAAWNQQFETNEKHVKVYNCVSASSPLTNSEMLALCLKYARQMPSSKAAWYYSVKFIDNKLLYTLAAFLFHTIPAILIDLILILSRNKPLAVDGFRKAHNFLNIVSFFSLQTWKFNDFNMRMLYEKLNPDDKKLFDCNVKSLNWDDYLYRAVYGGRRFMFNDNDSNIAESKKRMDRLKIVHYTVLGLLYLFGFWIILNLIKFFLL